MRYWSNRSNCLALENRELLWNEWCKLNGD